MNATGFRPRTMAPLIAAAALMTTALLAFAGTPAGSRDQTARVPTGDAAAVHGLLRGVSGSDP